MKNNSELYVYDMSGDFIVRVKTLKEALKVVEQYAYSFVVDVADHFVCGDKDSYYEGVMIKVIGKSAFRYTIG